MEEKIRAWTDYPIDLLGDCPRQEAPIRECEPISYDGDKYVVVRIDGRKYEIKSGYVYSRPGRGGEVPTFDTDLLILDEKQNQAWDVRCL